jgi:hypothetical protein
VPNLNNLVGQRDIRADQHIAVWRLALRLSHGRSPHKAGAAGSAYAANGQACGVQSSGFRR